MDRHLASDHTNVYSAVDNWLRSCPGEATGFHSPTHVSPKGRTFANTRQRAGTEARYSKLEPR